MANTLSYLFGLILALHCMVTMNQVEGSQSVIYKKVNITMLRPPVLLSNKESAARHLEKPLGPVLTKADLEGHNAQKFFGLPRRRACTLECKYGRERDVEGREICRCKLAPCKRIECPQGMKCLVKKFCQYGVCDDKPYCEVENTCKLAKPNNFYFGCAKLTKRYYFDTKKGKCRRFWGCKEIEGNNFSTKRECKRTCYKKRRGHKKADYKKVSDFKKVNNAIPLPQKEDNTLQQIPKQRMSNSIPTKPIQLLRPKERTAPRLLYQKCPVDRPYRQCPYDPCSKCKSLQVMCFKSFCGYCQAVFINMKTGRPVKSTDSICRSP